MRGTPIGTAPSPRSTRTQVRHFSLLLREFYLNCDVHIAFYRQSLTNQRLHAELFHNANALRNVNGPDDVQRMPQAQRELAIRSIRIAGESLELTVNSPAYREGMKYGRHSRVVSPPITFSCNLQRCIILMPQPRSLRPCYSVLLGCCGCQFSCATA